jgi:signal transduction histidine kinase
MKLWQKVFIYSLLLVTLSVAALAALVSQQSHLQNLKREEMRAAQEHGTLVNALQASLIYERYRQGDSFLSQQDTVESFSRNVDLYTAGRRDLAVELYQGDTLLYSSLEEDLRPISPREELSVEQGQCMTLYHGSKRLYASCQVQLEGQEYIVITSRDISSVFDQRRDQLYSIATGGIIVAGIIGLVLLIITRTLLNPLSRLERAADSLSAGNYSVRLPLRGHDEMAVVSEAFNSMAEAVENTVADLEAIAEDRKRFTDNLAHEMKTPLTSIIGYADLLRSARRIDDNQRLEYADAIYQEGQHLKTLSGKLMELILVGRTSVERKKIDLVDFLLDIAQLVEPMVVQRQLTMTVDCPGRLSLWGDRPLLQSLLFNLIDNAAKASNPGSNIELAARRDRRGRIHLTVTDHGRGMPPEETRKVTQAFYMLDKARTRAEGGAGLGLALCLEIAKCHNAQLAIQSHTGVGTTVEIIFPQEGAL